MMNKQRMRSLALAVVLLIISGMSLAGAAQPINRALPEAEPLHPHFALLDVGEVNVLVSGKPVSTLKTCGACHDTEFIQSHSYHASLGLDEVAKLDEEAMQNHAWDSGSGAFGNWDALRYRYLSSAGDYLLDLGTPDWVMRFGDRHVGGGPALYARDGHLLSELPADAGNPETAVLDPGTGAVQAWNWVDSGVVEMNCFLCHLSNPNNDARVAALQSGQFGWANTATLVGTGLVESSANDQYRWLTDAFDEDGMLKTEYAAIQGPSNANCGQCHGLVHTDTETPLSLIASVTSDWSTTATRLSASLTTGQVISAQRITDSGMNLAGKSELSRAWDIHAARQVQCTDCHFSLNNPVYFRESDLTRPDHLTFDPRRLDLGEYLKRPVHDFAKGAVIQHTAAPELADTMRRCDGCHNAANTHEWLPYTQRHLDTVACESCHIPEVYAPALQSLDWTVLTADGEPRREFRGVDGDPLDATSLVTGFQPVLLSRQDVDGKSRLAPHNLVTFWYWSYDDPPRPVRLTDLQAAWFYGESYAAEVVAALDSDGDGALATAELVLDTEAKQQVIAIRLAALNLSNPRITGEVQPYAISHNVTDGKWVTRECTACHGANSRLVQSLALATTGPTGVTPALLTGEKAVLNGELSTDADGSLHYMVTPARQGLYIFGQSRVAWVDWLGLLAFLGVLAGVSVHGALRFVSARRHPKHPTRLDQVYIYEWYKRFWHWLQTFTIVGLLFTGLIIHRPDIFGIFSFSSVVYVHNVLAAIVVINAALSLFYHLTNGEVRQFIPRPHGFYDQAILQAKYYLRGIFTNEPHPFKKTKDHKLNPLQQVTYFGLLNVLLPGQIITGILMWGAQQWPEAAQRVGGLPLLAPVHSLISWLLAAFIVIHVYLATTGHTPLALIQAMVVGWEDVEIVDTHAPTPRELAGHREILTPTQEASHGS